MSDVAVVMLTLSAVAHAIAAIIALWLNWRFSWRWAWTLISLGFALMAVRRSLILYQIVVIHDSAKHGVLELGVVPAAVSLLISLLILAGVVLIDPIFRKIARADEILRADRDGLRQFVSEKEVEFDAARRIQQSLFPKDGLRTPNLEVSGKCWPAAETAGDYYDHFPTADGGLLVLIGDVSGHGLGPALVMAETRTWVRAFAESDPDPGRLLCRLNSHMANEIDGYFVTMVVICITADARQLRYASAGHPAYLVDGQGVTELAPKGPPLGVVADSIYESSPAITLAPKDLLFLPTDGLFEATSPQGEEFGIDRSLTTIRNHRDIAASDLVKTVYDEVCQFSNNRLRDDVTMEVVRVLDQTR